MANTSAPRRPRRPAGKPADLRTVVDPTENPPTEPKPVLEDIPMATTEQKPPVRPRSGSLEARLAQVFASASPLPALMGDQYSAFIIASRSAKFAHDLAELAKVNPRLKKALEGMLDGGAYGGVLFSGAAMLLPILWAYGVIPPPPVDPFAPFYPQLPPGVVPRSVRKASRSAANRADSAPGANRAPNAPGGAPGPATVAKNPSGDNTPEGVVTVKPEMVPPGNPAA
jgi:hypothetical protein